MITVGLDVGTTTISGVVYDSEAKKPLRTLSSAYTPQISTDNAWENLQDPSKIWSICAEMLEAFYADFPSIARIGLTGQMHGIVYVDRRGQAVSPLITWQDGRGDLPFQNEMSYADILSQMCGYPMSTGFGLTTHFYNMQNSLVPPEATAMCTIADYVSMRLCGLEKPLIHASNAHSMGMFDVEKGQFDPEAISQADIDNDLLPALVMGEAAIGETAGGVEVWAAIGDNQASFLGATGGRSNLLANVGTSSQLSVRSKRMVQATGLDTRPYVQGEYLLVGAGLCGGSAYALLRDLFADVLNLYEINAEKDALYQKMNAAAKHTIESKNPLVVDIRFRGTRMTPGVRGAITQIGTENFTIGQLALGVMRGICEELYGFYALVPKGICGDDETMVGSGNALRKNEVLRGVLARRFGKILQLSPYEEDGALGISRFVSSQ